MFFSNNSTKNGRDYDDDHDLFSIPASDHSFHLPISFFPFPSHFDVDDDQLFNNNEYDSLLFHDDHHQQPQNFTCTNNNNPTINDIPTLDKIPTNYMEADDDDPKMSMNINSKDDDEIKKKMGSRKRVSKKDRHSKITTARGVRDRRMRLSLPVARQFFGLQDMLGADKGSKTVEWLLIQARPEILKLAQQRNYNHHHHHHQSNSSEGDNMAVSGIDEVAAAAAQLADEHFGKKMKFLKKKKKRVNKQPRKTMAKEVREKARERARARTMLKKNQLISSSASNQFDDHEIIMPNKWSPSDSTFNYLHQIQNLDLQQQHEFGDTEIFG